MTVVVDASVLASSIARLPPNADWSREAMSEGPLNVPELALAEATNTLRQMELIRRISSPQAEAARRELLLLDLVVHPFREYSDRIWELRHSVTATTPGMLL